MHNHHVHLRLSPTLLNYSIVVLSDCGERRSFYSCSGFLICHNCVFSFRLLSLQARLMSLRYELTLQKGLVGVLPGPRSCRLVCFSINDQICTCKEAMLVPLLTLVILPLHSGIVAEFGPAATAIIDFRQIWSLREDNSNNNSNNKYKRDVEVGQKGNKASNVIWLQP